MAGLVDKFRVLVSLLELPLDDVVFKRGSQFYEQTLLGIQTVDTHVRAKATS